MTGSSGLAEDGLWSASCGGSVRNRKNSSRGANDLISFYIWNGKVCNNNLKSSSLLTTITLMIVICIEITLQEIIDSNTNMFESSWCNNHLVDCTDQYPNQDRYSNSSASANRPWFYWFSKISDWSSCSYTSYK